MIERIIQNGYPKMAVPIKFKDLDKSMCSTAFLNHRHFDDDDIIYVECNSDETLKLRIRKRNKKEYRIVSDKKFK